MRYYETIKDNINFENLMQSNTFEKHKFKKNELK